MRRLIVQQGRSLKYYGCVFAAAVVLFGIQRVNLMGTQLDEMTVMTNVKAKEHYTPMRSNPFWM